MPAAPPGPKSATVLLVEDHEDSRAAFGQILASLGHQVLPAANGREALQILATTSPDLVLCDLRMPGMDGFDLMAALHAQGALPGLTVVAVTGSMPDIATTTRLKAAGFAGQLTKPLDYDMIVQALDTFLIRPKPRHSASSQRRKRANS
jgi:CheY-like chemotaxis protein